MRTMKIAFLFCFAACGGTQLGNNTNDITAKDQACAAHRDPQSCSSDLADECTWLGGPLGGPAIACPLGAACPPVGGQCVGPISGGGTLGDAGVGTGCTVVATQQSNCKKFQDSASCQADTVDDCRWYVLGLPCQAGTPCTGGICSGPPLPDFCGDGGKPVPQQGCACPNGGVCIEQVGGPALPAGGPAIQCVAPSTGCLGWPADCACIQGQGRCSASTTVSGLCVCDNGIR